MVRLLMPKIYYFVDYIFEISSLTSKIAGYKGE